MNILGTEIPDLDALRTVQVWTDRRACKYRIVIGEEEITGKLDPRKSICEAFAEVANIIAVRAGFFGRDKKPRPPQPQHPKQEETPLR